MHYALLATANNLTLAMPYIVAALILAGGVVLHLDYQNEDCYIETRPNYDQRALSLALAYTWRAGLEPLDESEDEPMTTPDGGVRIYLAQRRQV